MIDFLAGLDDWQSHDTAPKDGTHIVVSQDGCPIGVFHWEDRPEHLLKTNSGKPMPPAWVGVYFISEFDPMKKGDVLLGDRMFGAHGLDEPFLWRPLPGRPKKFETQ
ncbi:hypothetical protein [Leisingera sp. ANG59]|uniref:hypothetical protein n=1 Tax=Leisingera sp. ANG59 TaxID=2675221 RepID=UPI0015739EAB|nr:hypothetical protein [Leisingera sp. ANG59]NSY40706.1 hypothetical protein [Leisingera sp. ANG59]